MVLLALFIAAEELIIHDDKVYGELYNLNSLCTSNCIVMSSFSQSQGGTSNRKQQL